MTTEAGRCDCVHRQELPGISNKPAGTRKVLETSLANCWSEFRRKTGHRQLREADDYVKKGYSLNDRGGNFLSGKEYESVLQGKTGRKKKLMDKNGNMESAETISKGSKGNNFEADCGSEGVYAVAMDLYGVNLGLAGVRKTDLGNRGEASRRMRWVPYK